MKRGSGRRSIWANWKCHGLLNLGREPEELSSPCWVALRHLYPYIHSTSLASTSPDVGSSPPPGCFYLAFSPEDCWKVAWLIFRALKDSCSHLSGNLNPRTLTLGDFHPRHCGHMISHYECLNHKGIQKVEKNFCSQLVSFPLSKNNIFCLCVSDADGLKGHFIQNTNLMSVRSEVFLFFFCGLRCSKQQKCNIHNFHFPKHSSDQSL